MALVRRALGRVQWQKQRDGGGDGGRREGARISHNQVKYEFSDITEPSTDPEFTAMADLWRIFGRIMGAFVSFFSGEELLPALATIATHIIWRVGFAPLTTVWAPGTPSTQ